MWDPGHEHLTCGKVMETCDTSVCGGDVDVRQETVWDRKESFAEHLTHANTV